jgi:fluoroacetyl-CoA thioesterase
VTFRATVLAVDGRRVRFAVEAVDAWERVAEGVHERVIVDVARFAARVAGKRNR